MDFSETGVFPPSDFQHQIHQWIADFWRIPEKMWESTPKADKDFFSILRTLSGRYFELTPSIFSRLCMNARGRSTGLFLRHAETQLRVASGQAILLTLYHWTKAAVLDRDFSAMVGPNQYQIHCNDLVCLFESLDGKNRPNEAPIVADIIRNVATLNPRCAVSYARVVTIFKMTDRAVDAFVLNQVNGTDYKNRNSNEQLVCAFPNVDFSRPGGDSIRIRQNNPYAARVLPEGGMVTWLDGSVSHGLRFPDGSVRVWDPENLTEIILYPNGELCTPHFNTNGCER